MKKLVYTVFVAFWAAIGTLVFVNLLAPHPTPDAQRPEYPSVELPGYSLAELAEHDTLDDCWMLIEGAVYEVSDYLPKHPGGSAVVEPWCGREATVGMRTKGGETDHSARTWRMLERYRIGQLEQQGRL